MKQPRQSMTSLFVCVALAVPCIALGYVLSTQPSEDEGASTTLLLGLASWVTAALLLAVPIARLASQPVVELYYPDEMVETRRPRQPPSCRFPEMLLRQGRYEDALREYRKIAGAHPDELRPRIGMLHVALVHLQDPIRASDLYREATRGMGDRDQRHELWRRYRELGAQVDLDEAFAPPEPQRPAS